MRRPKGITAAPALMTLGAVTIGLGVGVAPIIGSAGAVKASSPTYADTATNCRVVDGGTLHCDGGRIRLLGIDAPELPGHCARGRNCAPGDPYASTHSLEAGMGEGATLRIESIGTDRYGRTLALVRGSGGDLSCWQFAHHQAIYRVDWDNGGRVANTCPEVAGRR